MLSGYTLPVFATASAVAGLQYLQNKFDDSKQVSIDLINPEKIVSIEIEQIAKISASEVLAITKSDPGDNLDLTRDTPIWAIVKLTPSSEKKVIFKGGEGVGQIVNKNHQSAIYSYAQNLLQTNLLANLESNSLVEVTIILPEGKKLALKTSNSAFGVVEGLSLLGTSGIAQPLTSKEQLDIYQQELLEKAEQHDTLIFCIGENGLDLAPKLGFNPEQLIKTANWLGSMLVSATQTPVKSIILLGYHGKLIKLAGNIFHTHHKLADARLEILTGIGAYLGLPHHLCSQIFEASTTESALKILRNFDEQNGSCWQEQIYQFIANRIEQNSVEYINKNVDSSIKVGAILFDRDRQVISRGEQAQKLMGNF